MRIAASLLLISAAVSAAQTPAAGQNPPPGPADVLQVALDENQYFVLSSFLEHIPDLKKEQSDYFEGMLAFHQGRFEDARKSLIAALNANPTALTSVQKVEAFQALAENARLTHLYGACAEMNNDIIKIWGDRLGAAQRDIEQSRHFCAAQQHTPVQSITFPAPFTIERRGREYPIRIGNIEDYAELDTGASESVITESTAKAWGIAPSDATVLMHGYSGGEYKGHPAVIPELAIGSATLHNVAVIIAPDAEFYIAPVHLQMRALIGLPVLLALGRLTFTRSGSLTVSPTSPAAGSTDTCPLWLGSSQVLVQLRTLDATGQAFHFQTGNELRLFVLDTGSRSSYFTDHYLKEHRESFAGPPPETAKLAGAGGEADIPAYGANHIPLWCSNSMVSITGPHVLTEPQAGVIEKFEGLLGSDVLDAAKSYTIDLRSMRFSVQP